MTERVQLELCCATAALSVELVGLNVSMSESAHQDIKLLSSAYSASLAPVVVACVRVARRHRDELGDAIEAVLGGAE